MKVVEHTGQSPLAPPAKTTWYYYNCGGNVTRFVSRNETVGAPENMSMGGGIETQAFGGGGAPGSMDFGTDLYPGRHLTRRWDQVAATSNSQL